MQDELLLLFRKNGNPIKNAKVCFYKDGHITKPQNTARDGTLLIKRPEESFIQFRFGSYRTIHAFALSQYKNIIRHEIKAEWENNLLHLEGKIFSEAKKVRLVYRNGQDVENEQEVEVDNGMFRHFSKPTTSQTPLFGLGVLPSLSLGELPHSEYKLL